MPESTTMNVMKILLFFISPFFLFSCGQGSFFNKKMNEPVVVASIDYAFQGCFGGNAYNLQILEEYNKTTAVLTQKGRENELNRTVLDSNGIKAFNEFIRELKETDFSQGCTTTAYYSVNIGDKTFEKTDGSCSWNGFSNLEKYLFKQ